MRKEVTQFRLSPPLRIDQMGSPNRNIVGWLALAVAVAACCLDSAFSQPGMSLPVAFSVIAFDGVEPPRLRAFPMTGAEHTITLPPELAGNFRIIESAANGTAIFGEREGSLSDGILKVGLKPLHVSAVPGSEGLGQVVTLTESPQGGRIVVRALAAVSGGLKCGLFEIDPTAGTRSTLLMDSSSQCTEGPASPDGKRFVSREGDELAIKDFNTGSVLIAKGIKAGEQFSATTWSSACTWSPDGRWLAARRSGEIVLVDASDPSHHGRAGGQPESVSKIESTQST
jgi:hypothetical protein